MTRFAGDDIASFMGGGPNMSALTQNAAARAAKSEMLGMDIVSDMGATGATQLGETLAQQAVSEAEGQLASAQADAKMMSKVGSIGGNLLGGLGDMGGSGFAGNAASIDTSGFGFKPSTQVEFGHGGGTHNGFGTFGPDWGY